MDIERSFVIFHHKRTNITKNDIRDMTIYKKCQQTGDTSIHDEYTYICQNSSGTIEMPLTGQQIKSICTMGDNNVAVEEVANNERVSEWMGKYSNEQIREAVAECGDWTDQDLSDRKANINRFVWAFAWDIFDSENPNENLAIDELQNI